MLPGCQHSPPRRPRQKTGVGRCLLSGVNGRNWAQRAGRTARLRADVRRDTSYIHRSRIWHRRRRELRWALGELQGSLTQGAAVGGMQRCALRLLTTGVSCHPTKVQNLGGHQLARDPMVRRTGARPAAADMSVQLHTMRL